MADSDIASKLASFVGQTLPVKYLLFLNQLPALPTLGEGYSPILDFNGRQWRPYDRKRMAELVQYGSGSPIPRAHETSALAEELRGIDAQIGGEISTVLSDRGFSLDRLARGFSIGDAGNGEPLFVDSESGGVFVFYHDGMDVELWASSLTKLIAGSRDWMGTSS